MNLSWLVLLGPLASAAMIWFFFQRNAAWAIATSITGCALAFLASLGLWSGWLNAPGPFPWIDLPPNFVIEIGWHMNGLSKAMLLVVTTVGLAVHVFSVGYMSHDPGKARFFGELSLFMFSMLGIVIADNLVMMYIFWELVGLSSYLLVGFWFQKPSASAAAKKAFLCNRVGDFGFLLGILFFWTITGTVSISNPDAILGSLTQQSPEVLTALGLLLFCGCIGKSAQFPLHVWLPDAMEGPTPVSALIHAATMVAAGVYMLCRVFFVLELSPSALFVIGSAGAFMTLFAAVIGTQQDDIKRILAYSTLSQLGYMVLAVGLGAPGLAMFHLTTHAFFKALLFLGSGSVIHGMHDEQNIWKMGGLLRKMPVTAFTFFCGTLALAGLPPLAGFWSKDPIIDLAGHHLGDARWWWYLASLIAAGFTAFYMGRLCFAAFLNAPNSEAAEHAHESSAWMTAPLVFLAVFALAIGFPFLGLEHFYSAATGQEIEVPATLAAKPILVSLAVFLAGAGLAWYIYGHRKEEVLRGVPFQWFRDKFYIDEIYDHFLLVIQQGLARGLAWIDNWVLGGVVVRGIATVASIVGELLRLFQTGNLQVYAFFFAAGAALLTYFVIFSP
jgi:NADH-quinone oxidoreductase subunit L